MLLFPPTVENNARTPVLRLIVDLPSRPRLFLSNLRAVFISSSSLPLTFSRAEFWPDVFVQAPLPWTGFVESLACHILALALLIGLTHIFSLQPRVVATNTFDHSQVIYYQPSEYLPPLDTRESANSEPQRSDPELSPQPIISVPPEADNHSQTVVTAPKVKLKRDLPMPNIVSWAEQQKPTLAIPAAPLTPAADLKRMAPKLENAVVAPPPELVAEKGPSAIPGLQPALIAPPPEIEHSTARPGNLTIGPSEVIAPAPQLPVAEQRAAFGGRGNTMQAGAPQIVAPPPSVSGSEATGSRGQVIALNLRPAVGAPPDPSAGNRRGSFSAGPEGHAGASGAPGSASGDATPGSAAKGNGKDASGGLGKSAAEVPSGLYVGKGTAKTSAVAGDPSRGPASSVNPNLLASARQPRASVSRPMQPESATRLSEPERAVFGNRKFYSVTLNMPNLNSAGGSWIIRFAEKQQSAKNEGNGALADLSQPMATRKVDPAYPTQLMRENVAGTVILYAVIHGDGTVGNVRVLRGVDDRLDRYAAEALAQWKFEPATKNGTAVDVEATFQIPFRPSRLGSDF